MTARRVTILRHEPADTGLLPHFDLLVEPGATEVDLETRDVPTWRCPRRLDQLEIGLDFRATRIGPHRRWWLSRPVGESVSLTPPMGIARVIARGRLLEDVHEDPEARDVTIEWASVAGMAGHPDSTGVRIRIESLDGALARIERRRASTSNDCCCHPGTGTCC